MQSHTHTHRHTRRHTLQVWSLLRYVNDFQIKLHHVWNQRETLSSLLCSLIVIEVRGAAMSWLVESFLFVTRVRCTLSISIVVLYTMCNTNPPVSLNGIQVYFWKDSLSHTERQGQPTRTKALEESLFIWRGDKPASGMKYRHGDSVSDLSTSLWYLAFSVSLHILAERGWNNLLVKLGCMCF